MKMGKGSGRLTLIQQNDIHAQLDLHPEHFWKNGEAVYRQVGGAARTATVVRGIRQEVGDALFFDCGDAIHGTGPAVESRGAVVVPVLNALGIDGMTPGNWEYAFGPDLLWERARELAFPMLACNVQYADTGERPLEPFMIRESGGLRIGVVGLTSPIIPQMSPDYAAGLRFPDVRKNIARCVRRLREREGVDLVVAISHVGYPQDMTIARETGGIDVILSGHTHNRLSRPTRVGNTLIIQSGFSGSFLGRLDLEVSSGIVIDADHALITLEETVEPDPAVRSLVRDLLAPYADEMSEVVGQTATSLDRMGLVETTMDNLVTDAYRDLTGAEVALSHGWRFAPPVPAGNVTVGDLWTMVPTNPEVMVGRMTGQELVNLLEDNMHNVLSGNAFEQSGGYLTRVSGLSVLFRPNNMRGSRVEHLEVNGEPYQPGREYTVAAMDARDTAGMRAKEPAGMRAIDALRRYFARHSPVDASLTYRKFIVQ